MSFLCHLHCRLVREDPVLTEDLICTLKYSRQVAEGFFSLTAEGTATMKLRGQLSLKLAYFLPRHALLIFQVFCHLVEVCLICL